MEWIEITADTVGEAEERALDELGIDRDEAEFKILEEPRRGLFNQVRGKARVRARVAPKTPRPKSDRRTRRPKGAAPATDGSVPIDKSESSSEGKSASGRSSRATKRSKDRNTGASESKPAAPRSRPQTTEVSEPEEEGTTMTMTLDDQVTATEAFLEGLLDAIGLQGRVSTERTDEANAHVNIEGDDLGLLIGPRGQTMNAIQDLARITLQKQAAGSWEGHVHVDVNGYRAKRREALVAFVEKVAADVIESGSAKALEPMSSSDRKVVHDTVNSIDGVRTSSEGYEPRRWVMISPAEG